MKKSRIREKEGVIRKREREEDKKEKRTLRDDSLPLITKHHRDERHS